jgi:hypothetical protein
LFSEEFIALGADIFKPLFLRKPNGFLSDQAVLDGVAILDQGFLHVLPHFA